MHQLLKPLEPFRSEGEPSLNAGDRCLWCLIRLFRTDVLNLTMTNSRVCACEWCVFKCIFLSTLDAGFGGQKGITLELNGPFAEHKFL